MSKLMIVEVPSYSAEFKGIREVLELVRCVECKKKGTEECPMKIWNYTWGEYEFFNDANDFCSCGERED